MGAFSDRQIIRNATQTLMLFPDIDKCGSYPKLPRQSNHFLPSTYPFRSSHQIDNNALTLAHSTQSMHNMPKLSQHQYPYSCIGLVLCEQQQNNNTYYVYGTGILIHEKIVLTSAKNVYCRRLDKEYINIKFITGVSGNKCSGIYDTMRLYYPKEYLKQDYQNYDFAILQLYDDLSKMYGYVGWKTDCKIQSKETIALGYINNYNQRSFDLRQLTKYEKLESNIQICSGSAILNKERNQYYLVGLQYLSNGIYKRLSQVMRRMIKKWTKYSSICIWYNNMGQKCNQIAKYANSDLREMILTNDKISAQGCKYLSQANWIHLTKIDLVSNNISAQGCKYLSQANWTHLTKINLQINNIGAQGCKYLSQANWTHLTKIDLQINNIGAQGCKYLSQANWTQLTSINLYFNNIGSQGCKYLSQANWTHLTKIDLWGNNIGAQGCKYLSQANWIHLTSINLHHNNIGAQGCKYLSQANWTHLTSINLHHNNIGSQGCKYLSQVNWTHLTSINLQQNNIEDRIYRLLLNQSYPNVTAHI